MMNRTTIIGNLTKDPELQETTSGKNVCRFTVAVNRNYTASDGARPVDFFGVVAWGGLAENVAKYTKKGNKVAVQGAMESRSYEDSQGVKRTTWELIADDIEFLTAKTSSEEEAVNRELAAAEEKGAAKSKKSK